MRKRPSALPALMTVVWIASSAKVFASPCHSLTEALHQCERIVGSLRPDKAGQMRVFAPDGSEFTAQQAQWMRAELAHVMDACDRGNMAEAARRLASVQALLNEHRRSG